MISKQAVVRKHNKSRPLCCCLAISLHSQSLDGSTGLPEDNQPLARNVADKKTKKSIENNNRGRGNQNFSDDIHDFSWCLVGV